MKKKTNNPELVEFPAIIIDEEKAIFFPNNTVPRVGILKSSKGLMANDFEAILRKTRCSFHPSIVIDDELNKTLFYWNQDYVVLFFLGDMRTLRKRINGKVLENRKFSC
ncbi:MAG TPA: hypothetical protein PK816_12200 [Candidatus Cloacimonadota bacterium]|jgi:hypothetical protein|nr:hypothetical protein [Candidatus Cloacimonadota bacterium]